MAVTPTGNTAKRNMRHEGTVGAATSSMSGLPADVYGNPTIDPTKNVLDLVDAAVTRIDDMAVLREQLRSERAKYADEIRQAETQRLDDLRAAESRRVDEQASMRAEFQEKVSIGESKRIDAIRAVDVAAVAVASERATQQATVLATQVSTSADALRTLVATTAAAMAATNQSLTTQLTDRIATLEKAQYELRGKSAVVDPQMEMLLGEMRGLRERASADSGKSAGISMTGAMVMGGVSLVAMLFGIASALYAVLKP